MRGLSTAAAKAPPLAGMTGLGVTLDPTLGAMKLRRRWGTRCETQVPFGNDNKN